MTALANAHQEVVWFDIAMNKVSRVDVLDTRNLTMVEWVPGKYHKRLSKNLHTN